MARVSSLRWKSSSNRSSPPEPAARERGAVCGARRKSSMPMREGASALAFRQLRDDLRDDAVGADALRFALEVEEHAVAERRERRRLHVVDRGREPPVEERAD